MGRMTIEQLKQKYGTEGIRLIAFQYDQVREDGGEPDWGYLDLMGQILKDVGECLTEEVT